MEHCRRLFFLSQFREFPRAQILKKDRIRNLPWFFISPGSFLNIKLNYLSWMPPPPNQKNYLRNNKKTPKNVGRRCRGVPA